MNDHTLTHLYRVFYDDLHLCGCGDPESAFQLVLDVLNGMPLYDDNNRRLVRTRIGSAGATHIVLSALTHADLIEHGGTIDGSWITDKGHWVREALRTVSIPKLDEQLDDVGHPHHGKLCTAACWEVPVSHG